MCDCVEQLEKKILEKVVTDKTYKKKVVSVKMAGKTYSLGRDKLKPVVSTDFNIELKGQIKKPTIGVQNTNCQFCGEILTEK